MKRRTFVAASGIGGLLGATRIADSMAQPASGAAPLKVGMLIYPQMIMLDLVGPQTVLSIMPSDIHLIWKTSEPVLTDIGLPVSPTTTFDTCPADLDVLFVPGGLTGSVPLMDDPEVLGFLADTGSRARYVTSVCTGALVLGAAGLLRGYHATSHWYVRDLLALMGAQVSSSRVVVDRNRITGGGVTAGIDFGLYLAALLTDEANAKRIQLLIEYDPMPPFQAGSPEQAGPNTTHVVLEARATALAAAQDAAARAGQRLGI